MLRDDLRTLWTEPRPPDPPARVRRDWALLAAGLAGVTLEATLRENVVWRPVAVVLAVWLCLLPLWRRTRPLAMVTLAFAQAGSVLVRRDPGRVTGGEEGLRLPTDHVPDWLVGVADTRNVYWLALVALAAAALVTAASRSHPQKPDATDLFLPILLAVASGLLVGLLVLGLAGLWVRWSRRRRAISSYVASRTVRRRHEGTLVILPVTAALTVAVFAVGVSLAASTWRASPSSKSRVVGTRASSTGPGTFTSGFAITPSRRPSGVA